MRADIPSAGTANLEQRQQGTAAWLRAAFAAGIDTSTFPSRGTLEERCNWAKSSGLEIGLVLSRYSCKLSHSTSAQINECMGDAASRNIYVPEEYLCVDEGISGRKTRRAGLERATALLKAKLVKAILIFKLSRLFRSAYKGFRFIQEEVVDEGLRAICASQGIDTANSDNWGLLLSVHSMSDEMLLNAVADHVRGGQKDLFRQGYAIGALPAGYCRVEVPGARPTNLGRQRTKAAVDPEKAAIIRTAFEDVRSGMPLGRAFKKYRAAGGPSDPRARGKPMSYNSFRRMLANPRYIGRWAFGRRKNIWVNKRDGVRQVDQPESEVVVVQDENLRIVSDETFAAVQAILARKKQGARGPQVKKTEIKLEDLLTECFVCHACSDGEDVRFYQAGADGKSMRCKHGDLCKAKGIVRRNQAVQAICDAIGGRIVQDTPLIAETLAKAIELDAGTDTLLKHEIEAAKRQLASSKCKLNDLCEMLGEGTEEERSMLKDKIRAVQSDRTALDAKLVRLHLLHTSRERLQPDAAAKILQDVTSLLHSAAAGELGEEAVCRAYSIIKVVTGGRILVDFQKPPGRKNTMVRGTFELRLLRVLHDEADLILPQAVGPVRMEVWLRPPPMRDRLAEPCHILIDVEGKGYDEAARILQAQGFEKMTPYKVWLCRRRYFEMHGLPIPKVPYNNGRPRRRRQS